MSVKVNLPNPEKLDQAIVLDGDNRPNSGAYRIVSTSGPSCGDVYVIVCDNDASVIFITHNGKVGSMSSHYDLDYHYTLEHANCEITFS